MPILKIRNKNKRRSNLRTKLGKPNKRRNIKLLREPGLSKTKICVIKNLAHKEMLLGKNRKKNKLFKPK